MNKPIDFRTAAGIMLRGKNVYHGASHSANSTGRNQYSKGAKLYLKRKRAKK